MSQVIAVILSVCRKLLQTECENILLRNPLSRPNRMRQLATLATSCRHISEALAVQPSITLIHPKCIQPTAKLLGSGIFGTCTMLILRLIKRFTGTIYCVRKPISTHMDLVISH